jgi:uncharacterized protein (DUF2237 family)
LFKARFIKLKTETKKMNKRLPKNVLGTELEPCCFEPMTGFFRDGYCRTGRDDFGVHIVCAEMTREFLEFSKRMGNDLSTPIPEYEFPGLQSGDRWCLCVSRWVEAWKAGVAPKVVLEATHMSAIEFADLDELIRHSVSK